MTLRRAAGEAAFAGDLVKAGSLHLALRRSSVPSGRVRGIDASGTRALPGVALVLTPDDSEGLLDPDLRYVGARVAVVAAEDPDLARRGADLLEVDVEERVAVLDPEDAAADPGRVVARVEAGSGDVEARGAAADHVVEGRWSFPFVPATSLEPSEALTWLDDDRRLVVRTSAESPFRVRGRLAERLGLPAARIRVARPLVASGASRPSGADVEELCALVTLRTGRPARLALALAEEMPTAPGRPPQKVSVRLGVEKGRITSLAVDLLVDVGDGVVGAEELLRSAGVQCLGLYDLPCVAFVGRAVRTHHPPTWAARGADAGAALALEAAVDEAARALGEDPLAFRRRHLGGRSAETRGVLEALGEPLPPVEPERVARLVETGAREAGWRGPDRGALHAAGVRRGRAVGMARRSPGAGSGTGAAASLRLLDDGSLTLSAAPSSAGGADETAYAEAAASILGLPLRRVVPAATDTDSAPFLSGDPAPAFFATGRAVEEAATLMRRRILEEGARLLDADPSRLTLEEGEVQERSGRKVDYAAVGAAALRAGRPLVVTASAPAASVPSSIAAAFAEVEIDEATGVVRVLDLTAVLAAGPFSDPRPAEGQAEGALATAVELALAAGVPGGTDPREAWPSLRHWPLVSAADVPPLRVRFVPADEPPSRFGTPAVSEAVTRAAVAAIAGAVAGATRRRLDTLPILPPRVLDALASPVPE